MIMNLGIVIVLTLFGLLCGAGGYVLGWVDGRRQGHSDGYSECLRDERDATDSDGS